MLTKQKVSFICEFIKCLSKSKIKSAFVEYFFILSKNNQEEISEREKRIINYAYNTRNIEEH